MKKYLILTLAIGYFSLNSFAQSTTIAPNYVVIPGMATLPGCTNTDKGKTIFNTTDNRMYYCDGFNWQSMAGVPSAGVGWAQNGSAIYNTNAGGVGIGTPFPLTKLTVYTPPSNYGLWHTDANIGLGTYLSPTAGLFGTTSNHSLGLFANGFPAKMIITPGGNIGIGTGSPTNKLQIGVGTNPEFQGNDLAISNASGGGMSFFQSGAATLGNSIWYSNSNFSLMPAFGGTGRVGVGTISPNSTFEITGSQGLPFKQINADYTPTELDYSIIVNMQDDANRIININLPSPALARGRIYNIKVIGCPLANTDYVRYDRDRSYANFFNYPGPGSSGFVAIKDANGDLITCLFEFFYTFHRGFNADTDFRSSRTFATLQSIGTRWVMIADNFNEFKNSY